MKSTDHVHVLQQTHLHSVLGARVRCRRHTPISYWCTFISRGCITLALRRSPPRILLCTSLKNSHPSRLRRATQPPSAMGSRPPTGAAAMRASTAGAPSRQLGSFESAVVGGVSGVVEVGINQPTVAWKNALQQRRALVLRPSELYRGVGINAASIAPITAVQFGANALLLRALSNPDGSPSSSAVKIGAAAMAGAASALVSVPAELVMIRQQRRQAPLMATAREALLTTPFRGFWLGAARDAIFTAGYLGLAPALADAVAAAAVGDGDAAPPAWARTAGSIVAGVFAGTASHGFDTVKTAVQGAEKGEPVTTRAAARMVMREGGGIKALFTGVFPRGLRIVIAVVVLQECKVRLEPALFPEK